jgi:hypothetical protein
VQWRYTRIPLGSSRPEKQQPISQMRHTANFHPEWGYLAPAPTFIRTARIVVVATAVGAILGVGTGFSWVGHQATEPSVAARTLVRPTEAISAGANTSAQLTPANSDNRSRTVNSRSADGAANEPSASSKRRVPEGMAPVAETPPATDGSATAAIAAPPATTKEPLLNVAPIKKKATKRSNVTWRFALRDEPLGVAPGGKRRSWGGYYGESSGRGYQNWW